MFCKSEVKLILERFWAEGENGRAEIRQGTVVIWRTTAGSRREVFLVHSYYANRATRHEHILTVYRICLSVALQLMSPKHSPGLLKFSSYRTLVQNKPLNLEVPLLIFALARECAPDCCCTLSNSTSPVLVMKQHSLRSLS